MFTPCRRILQSALLSAYVRHLWIVFDGPIPQWAINAAVDEVQYQLDSWYSQRSFGISLAWADLCQIAKDVLSLHGAK